MPTLADITSFLNGLLLAGRYGADEPAGAYRVPEGGGGRPVRRLALALAPWPDVGAWLRRRHLDALWLHRPWALDEVPMQDELPVLAHHLPFDERMTTGYNPLLAVALGLREPQVLGRKEGRPLGMVGTVPPRPFDAWRQRLKLLFGDLETVVPPERETVDRIAVVGAMNEHLLRTAHDRGAGLYVTGQYRPSAAGAVSGLGIGVAAVGHARAERWGLKALAACLRLRFADLTVVRAPQDRDPGRFPKRTALRLIE